MKMTTTMLSAFAASTLLVAPAFAQMQSSTMGNSTMAPKMTKMQTKQMQKCQAMSADMMAKNKTCAKMMKMHPEMINSNGM